MNLDYQIGKRRSGDVACIYANNSKARNSLHWDPKYTIDDAMLTAWQWQEQLNKAKHGDTVHL